LTKFLQIAPKDLRARFNRALAYESLREYDKAIADYTKVIEGKTDFSRNGDGKDKCLARTHHYRGRAYQWYKQENAKAVADYTEALRLDPEIEMVHYRRGQAYKALKEYAKAVADFTARAARPGLSGTCRRPTPGSHTFRPEVPRRQEGPRVSPGRPTTWRR
jgi:tetratricopeptide (TPR) repeat protein